MRFFKAIDEKGEIKLILKHRGKFLIFQKGSTLLNYLMENKASFFQRRKAVDIVEDIFESHEYELMQRRLHRLEKDKVSYIG